MMPHTTRGSRSGMGKIPESSPQAFSPGPSGGLDMPDQALQRSRAAVALARQLAHAHSLAWASISPPSCMACVASGVPYKHGQKNSSPAAEQGLAFWLPLGTFDQGWALVGQGQYEEGIACMRQGITGLRATGSQLGQSGLLRTLAEAVARRRRARKGSVSLTKRSRSRATTAKSTTKWNCGGRKAH